MNAELNKTEMLMTSNELKKEKNAVNSYRILSRNIEYKKIVWCNEYAYT